MTDGPSAPAGWYPQTDGSQRYWDGEAWTTPESTLEPTTSELRAGSRKRLAWIAVCVLVVGGCVWSGSRSGSQHQGPTDASVSNCERAVKAQLKSPSTAEFSEERWGDRSGGGYVLKGSVDSQNGFGAMIRSAWICTIDASGALDGQPVVI